jgi:hypothetical protein
MAHNPRPDVERHSTEPNPETLIEVKVSLPFSKKQYTDAFLFSAQTFPEFNLLLTFHKCNSNSLKYYIIAEYKREKHLHSYEYCFLTN